jgi:hypothetical protein
VVEFVVSGVASEASARPNRKHRPAVAIPSRILMSVPVTQRDSANADCAAKFLVAVLIPAERRNRLPQVICFQPPTPFTKNMRVLT